MGPSYAGPPLLTEDRPAREERDDGGGGGGGGANGAGNRAISLSWSSHRPHSYLQHSPLPRRPHSFHHQDLWPRTRRRVGSAAWRACLHGEMLLDKNPASVLSLCESIDEGLAAADDDELYLIDEPELSRCKLLSFAVGHMLNDMTLAVWLSFVLIYLKYVAGLRSSLAGIVMLAGQGADALATPLAGVVSDRLRPSYLASKGYSPRKTWYGLGFVLVAGSFYALLGVPKDWLDLDDDGGVGVVVYYATAAAVFNVGWALVQVNHMVLIPELSGRTHERVRLASARYAFTIISYIVVYGVMFIILSAVPAGLRPGSLDYHKVYSGPMFNHLTYLILGLGCLTGAVFWLGTTEKKEKRRPIPPRVTRTSLLHHLMTEEQQQGQRATQQGQQRLSSSSSSSSSSPPPVVVGGGVTSPESQSTPTNKATSSSSWSRWFSRPQFWVRGMIYMASKVTVNIVQIFLPNFIEQSLQAAAEDYIALVPLTMFIASFLSTLWLENLDSRVGHRLTYVIGCVVALVSFVGTGMLGVDGHAPRSNDIFFTTFLTGIGTCHMVVTAVALESDLVRADHAGGALVFGLFSGMEKLANGLIVFMAEYVEDAIAQKKSSIWGFELHESLSRHAWRMVCVVPAAACLVGLIMTVFVPDNDDGRRQGTTLSSFASAGGGERGSAAPVGAEGEGEEGTHRTEEGEDVEARPPSE